MQQFPSYWSAYDKVDYLQRKILINSISEQKLGINFMGDGYINEIIPQLIELQMIYPFSVNTTYGYLFKDFTPDKYLDLYSKLNDIDKREVDKICKLYRDTPTNKTSTNELVNYYILEEYINMGGPTNKIISQDTTYNMFLSNKFKKGGKTNGRY